MDLNEIISKQVEMDELHGFRVHFASAEDRQVQILKDIVGLVGEVGEFSNTVKKIGLSLDHPGQYELDVQKAEDNLKEELVDSLIYLFRLASILELDVEDEILKKMQLNSIRYGKIRKL